MPRWYYSTNGKAEGPVSAEFLIENLRKGQFTLVDLVFREGETAWKTFGEVPEFREVYQAPPLAVAPETKSDFRFDLKPSRASAATNASPDGFQKPVDGWPSDWRISSSWIVLRQRADKSGYDQDGPFTAEHIIEMIGEGKIDYSQYCWKPGYTRWFRIGNLPEFDRRKRDRENDAVNQIVPVPAIGDELPALSREELLANVERMRRPEPEPVFNEGENLVNDGLPEISSPRLSAVAMPQRFEKTVLHATVIQPETVIESQASEPEPAAATTDRFAVGSTTPANAPHAAAVAAAVPRELGSPPRQAPKAMRLGIAATVTALAVIVMLKLNSNRNDDAAETSRPASPTHRIAKTETVDTATAPAAPVAPPTQVTSAPRAPASVLEIVPLKLESSAPSLAFQSNAGPDEKISVRISARTGEILKFASYSKSLVVTRAGGEVATLDLAPYELPAGTYTIDAQVGSVQASKQVFVGVRDTAFVTALEHHLKNLSYRQQVEKNALFYGSARLEKLARTIGPQTQALRAQPRKLKQTLDYWQTQVRQAAAPVALLAKAPAYESAYPEQLAAFQAASARLLEQATRLEQATLQKRDIASATSIEDSVFDFSRLKAQSARLSGRP